MDIKFRCPKCGQKIKVPREAAGKQCKCQQCQAVCQIPKDPSKWEASSQNIFSVICSSCAKSITVSESNRGRTMVCPICGDKIQIPTKEKCMFLMMFVICIGVIYFVVICSFLYVHFKNEKKEEKALYDKCELLHQHAGALKDQGKHELSLETYKLIKVNTSDFKIKSQSFTDLLEDTDEQISQLNIIFAQTNIPVLNKIKNEADLLFPKEDFGHAYSGGIATKKYEEIVSFIEEHGKQDDVAFSGIYHDSKKRLALARNLRTVLRARGIGFTDIKKRCDELINDLRSIRSSYVGQYPYVAFKEIISKLKDVEIRANAYYENKKRMAENERKRKKSEIARKRELDAMRKAEAQRAQKIEAEQQKRILQELEVKKARVALFINDPSASYKEFCSNFMSNISKYELWGCSIYDKYQMSLNKTGNMLQPVIGKLTFQAKKYNEFFKREALYYEVILKLAPNDNKWIIVDAKYKNLGLNNYDLYDMADSPYLNTIITAYNETPNP